MKMDLAIHGKIFLRKIVPRKIMSCLRLFSGSFFEKDDVKRDENPLFEKYNVKYYNVQVFARISCLI